MQADKTTYTFKDPANGTAISFLNWKGVIREFEHQENVNFYVEASKGHELEDVGEEFVNEDFYYLVEEKKGGNNPRVLTDPRPESEFLGCDPEEEILKQLFEDIKNDNTSEYEVLTDEEHFSEMKKFALEEIENYNLSGLTEEENADDFAPLWCMLKEAEEGLSRCRG